jgi:hypothetical protein
MAIAHIVSFSRHRNNRHLPSRFHRAVELAGRGGRFRSRARVRFPARRGKGFFGAVLAAPIVALCVSEGGDPRRFKRAGGQNRPEGPLTSD